jgi:hypothetical protein
MALRISHHERVPGHHNRWHVHIHGRSQPIPVELPDEERNKLDLTDEEVHNLIPTALEKRTLDYPDAPPEEHFNDASAEAPVRIFTTHFMA